MSDAGMSDSSRAHAEAVESPFPSDSSSQSEAIEEVPVARRLEDLLLLQKQVALSLQRAADALSVLTSTPRNAVGQESVKARGPLFGEPAEAYMDLLEDTSARLKRNIRALEEEEVPVVPFQGRPQTSAWFEQDSLKAFSDHK